ncbi:MAG: hypothetical protein WD872_07830 [Pirellulaceae bacterium]
MSLLHFLQSSLQDAGLLPAGSAHPHRAGRPRTRPLQVESLERRAVLTLGNELPVAVLPETEEMPSLAPIAPLEAMPGSEQYPLPESGSPMGPLPAEPLSTEPDGSLSSYEAPLEETTIDTVLPDEGSTTDTAQVTAEGEDDGGVIIYDETVGTAPRIDDFHIVTIGEWFWFEGVVTDDDYVEGLSVNFSGSLGDFNATVNADGTFQSYPFHVSQQGSVKAYTIDWYGNWSNEVILFV